ncbi:MAG: hypothetical protein V1688_01185 [bacterium]
MNKKLPKSFKPILWSYDFSKIDSIKNKKTIIVNTINYGDLKHWKWLAKYYGIKEVQNELKEISASEFRPPALKLASILFSVNTFNYAPRGVKRQRQGDISPLKRV